METVKSFLKRIYLKYKFLDKCKFGKNTVISSTSKFEGMNLIGSHTHFDGFLGYGSYISSHSDIAMTKVGRFSSIGPRVVVNPGKHPYTYPFATTSPAFYSTRKQNSKSFVNKDFYDEFNFVDKDKRIATEIGNDCWIGEGVFIGGGIKIGDGAMILAHAVVTKDVESYSIVGGIPARHIKYRYDPEDIKILQNFQWWNKDVEWIKNHANLLLDFDIFRKYINESN